MSFLNKLFKKKDQINQPDDLSEKEIAAAGEFYPPLKGEIIPLTDVPDSVFSEKMLGDGFAIIPENNMVRSPVNGEVTNIFPTKHALSLSAEDGHELLIHVGVQTVALKGDGFEPLVKDGDTVRKGSRLLKVDFSKISKMAPSTITSIVFTNLKDGEKVVLDGNKVSLQMKK